MPDSDGDAFPEGADLDAKRVAGQSGRRTHAGGMKVYGEAVYAGNERGGDVHGRKP